MRILVALLVATLACACSGEAPADTGSSSGAATGSSGTGTSASSGSGASATSSTSGSSASSSASSSGSSGSTSSSSSTGTSGDIDAGPVDGGPADAGPQDAGPFTYATDPHQYWCNLFVDGGFTSFSQDDGGCIATLPACVGVATPLGPAIHVDEPRRIAYHEEPPNAGPHWPCWSPWGTLHAHTALPAERFIHNSEHQGVMVLYRCDPDAGLPDGGSCDAMAAPLIAFVEDGGPDDPYKSYPARRYLVTARPELPTNYAAVAWGWTLLMDDWDAGVASCFASAHLGAGPEPVPYDPDPTGCPNSYVP